MTAAQCLDLYLRRRLAAVWEVVDGATAYACAQRGERFKPARCDALWAHWAAVRAEYGRLLRTDPVLTGG